MNQMENPDRRKEFRYRINCDTSHIFDMENVITTLTLILHSYVVVLRSHRSPVVILIHIKLWWFHVHSRRINSLTNDLGHHGRQRLARRSPRPLI